MGKVTIRHNIENYGRDITGHTRENQNIQDSWLFGFGAHSRDFSFAELPRCNETDTPDEYAEKLRFRLEKVREWVEECKIKDRAASGIGKAILLPSSREMMAEIAAKDRQIEELRDMIDGLEAQLPEDEEKPRKLSPIPARDENGRFVGNSILSSPTDRDAQNASRPVS